jgi:hypothetical protein
VLPYSAGGEVQRQARERGFHRQKREIIESLDLLVIDALSMVRSDLLDAVDFVLRRQRRSELPFGGVQLENFLLQFLEELIQQHLGDSLEHPGTHIGKSASQLGRRVKGDQRVSVSADQRDERFSAHDASVSAAFADQSI